MVSLLGCLNELLSILGPGKDAGWIPAPGAAVRLRFCRFLVDKIRESRSFARGVSPLEARPWNYLPGTKGFRQTVIAKRLFLIATAGLLWCTVSVAEPAGSFARPPTLEPDILFWTRVYTEVDTRGGLIHDSRSLGVVYEVLRFPESAGSRTQRRLVKAAKNRYKNILLALA